MSRRKLTGAKLSEDIGLSATSVSRIITGHSKPKQVTLTRLMKRLCASSEDEQMLLRAFSGLRVPTKEEPISNDPRNSLEERERVERWLEARTQAITFKDAVARELDKVGINYRRDVCDGIASADFLIERGSQRIALECKFNVGRDFDKTVGIARLLCELLRCNRVIIVVPFIAEFADAALTGISSVLIRTPVDAVTHLKEIA
jgi:hypothetical protein